MATQRPAPSTVAQHLASSPESWHGKVAVDGPFPPEKGRYRLYIGLFCPFAHRVNLVRHLKGLQDIIPLTVVKPYPKGDEHGWPGWQFASTPDEYPGADPDPLFGAKYLHELYFKADPAYKGRYSVPVLWDAVSNTIVNNESAELLRDLQTSFDSFLPPQLRSFTLYPDHLREAIDAHAPWLQYGLNSGVYRAGFAPSQAEYDAQVPIVFAALNRLERLISHSAPTGQYVLGPQLTELDIRAYTSVVRFDAVYVQHFKCNLATIRHGYPVIHNWMKGLYWSEEYPCFRDTTDFRHIKENYTKSHTDINPRGITPMGPWPVVEKGVVVGGEARAGIAPGRVDMPEVVEAERALDEKFGEMVLA